MDLAPTDASTAVADGSPQSAGTEQTPKADAPAVASVPAPVRRGRGKFGCQLRTEASEPDALLLKLQQQMRAPPATNAVQPPAVAHPAAAALHEQVRDIIGGSALDGTGGFHGDMSSIGATSAGQSASVVLPSITLSYPKHRGRRHCLGEEEDDDETIKFESMKRNIPLDAHVSTPNIFREQFGQGTEEADTVRELLFRGDKRRRYCMVIGNLRSAKRMVSLKLFGHRGLKPFKLQDKLIRLINLSIGRPRPRKDPNTTVDIDPEQGENHEGEEGQLSENAMEPIEAKEPDQDACLVKDEELREPREGEEEKEDVMESAEEETERKDQKDQDDDSKLTISSAEEKPTAAPTTLRPPVPAGFDDVVMTVARPPAPIDGPVASARVSTMTVTNTSTNLSAPTMTSTSKGSGETEGDASVAAAAAGAWEEVDSEEDDEDDPTRQEELRMDDEVVPLTVQRAETQTAMMNELSLDNSPVLTARFFSTLKQYFMREFRYLLGMEDVRAQNVAVSVSLGAAYCCLARHGSYSRPLKHATFGEFVDRLNEEELQLYFIKDCPACVSRAVDMECGALHNETSLTLVKITFFSNERQGRCVARAVWDSEKNGFRLQDMENAGVSFNWTIFSLDETFVKEQSISQMMGNSASPDGGRGPVRNKTVAYPFEVEFRAFRRWKQQTEHPAAPLAEAILDRLSLAESNLINHGSSIGYERMDLSHVCEADFAADDYNVESIVVEHTNRGKPAGTDLLVDNTTSLFIENFAAARSLRERIRQYGRRRVAEEQNVSNNNYLRDHNYKSVHNVRGIRGGHSGGRGYGRGGRGSSDWDDGHSGHGDHNDLSEDVMEKVLQPTSKLTFFKSRGSTIHWKLRTNTSIEENVAPMEEALSFVQQVLHTANDIERNSARGGAGPEAL